MTTAKQVIDERSQGPTIRRPARERPDAFKLYDLRLTVTRLEVKARGEPRNRSRVTTS
jgi:hypothetical protein